MVKAFITLSALAAIPCLVAGAYTVETFDGPVTQKDVDSFKAGIKSLQPPNTIDNISLNWAQNKNGQETKAFGLVYQITKDTAILDKMLTYTDKLLSLRNDKSSKGCTIWTGSKDPVWVGCSIDVLDGKVWTGGFQGDYIGHLAYAARLILENQSIWNKEVPDKDPYKNGRTYLLRAKTYIREAEYSLDGHVFKSLLDVSKQNRQYFTSKSVYKGGLSVPWNQQMMFNYALSNLALAHGVLRDEPAKVTKYNAIVQASVDWFYSTVKTNKSKKGNPVYLWTYSPPWDWIEDANHAALDIEGFSRLFAIGNYKLAADKLKPFSNMVLDVLIRGKGDYAGRVDGTDGDGHKEGTNYLRSGYLLTAEWAPSSLSQYLIDRNKSITTIDFFSRLLYIKDRINKNKSKSAPKPKSKSKN